MNKDEAILFALDLGTGCSRRPNDVEESVDYIQESMNITTSNVKNCAIDLMRVILFLLPKSRFGRYSIENFLYYSHIC